MSSLRPEDTPHFTAPTGRLHGTTVPELLWALARSRATGRLLLKRSGTTKTVSFEEGRILFAGTDEADERLGEMLVRDGLITLEQLETASSKLGPGRRLGAALIEQGSLSPDDLVRSVLSQVRSILVGLIDWEDGEWKFEAGTPSVGQGIQLGVSPAQLILEGIRQLRSFSLLRKIVGSPSCRYRVAESADRHPAGLSLSEGEKLVLEALERAPQSIESLCEALVLSSFEVHQALAAFHVLGMIVIAPPDAARFSDSRRAGTFDRHDFLAVLARLCRDGETGVLHVARGGVERSFHLREGRCVFATSNDSDDGLIAHLFRRGVISLRDREEVCRRLLTNRRVGTLLLEMGVLDETDLSRAVRSQIKAIVLDSARWQDGSFEFSAGELPTHEDIILEDSLEDLVLAAARTVTSWTQVIRGAGGLDARLIVAPGYLEALDRMTVGSDTWDLVASLTEPRSIREVCRASSIGDFRASQTLWALRMLGIVTDAPAHMADAVQPPGDAVTAPSASPAAAEVEAGEAGPARQSSTSSGPATPAESVTTAAGSNSQAVENISDSPEQKSAEIHEGAAAASASAAPADVADTAPAPPTQASSGADRAAPDPGFPSRESSPAYELAPPGSGIGSSASEIPTADPAASINLELSDVRRIRAEAESSTDTDLPAAEAVRSDLKMAEPARTTGDPDSDANAPLDPELEKQIERFNASQQIVYRIVRSEVGAGASNFVRFCGLRLSDGFQDLFSAVDLMDDGTWDPAGIRAAVRKKAVLDPWLGFQRLLEKEIEMVQVHLGATQAEVLRKRLEEFDRADAAF